MFDAIFVYCIKRYLLYSSARCVSSYEIKYQCAAVCSSTSCSLKVNSITWSSSSSSSQVKQ